MKNAILTFLILIITTLGFAQWIPNPEWYIWEDNFSQWPSSNFDIYTISGSDWQNAGENWDFACTIPGSAYVGGTNEATESWLVSKAIEATSTTAMFFYQKSNNPELTEHNGIYVSTGSADPADGDYVLFNEPQIDFSSCWPTELSLAQFAGETIHVAFKYVGQNANTWVIDDFAIYNIPPVRYEFNFEYLKPIMTEEFYQFQVEVFNFGTEVVEGMTLQVASDAFFEETSLPNINSYDSKLIVFDEAFCDYDGEDFDFATIILNADTILNGMFGNGIHINHPIYVLGQDYYTKGFAYSSYETSGSYFPISIGNEFANQGGMQVQNIASINKNIYGIYKEFNTTKLVSIDRYTGSYEDLYTFDYPVSDFEFNYSDRLMYAIAPESASLISFDVNDVSSQTIVAENSILENAEAFTINKAGIMYVLCNNGEFYSINKDFDFDLINTFDLTGYVNGTANMAYHIDETNIHLFLKAGDSYHHFKVADGTFNIIPVETQCYYDVIDFTFPTHYGVTFNIELNNEPIAQAEVEFNGEIKESDENGNVYFDLVPLGYHTAKINFEGFDEIIESIQMVGYDEEVNIELNPVGINNINEATIAFFPNPAQDYIQLNDVFDSYAISSLTGETIVSHVLNNRKQISTKSLNNGVYIVHLYKGNTQEQHKLIINK